MILNFFGAPVSWFVKWGVKTMAQIYVTWKSHVGMATEGFPKGRSDCACECYLASLQLLHSRDGEWLFCLSPGNMVQVLAFFLALGGTSCWENMVLHSSCLWKVLCWEIARGNWQGAQILIFVVQENWDLRKGCPSVDSLGPAGIWMPCPSVDSLGPAGIWMLCSH